MESKLKLELCLARVEKLEASLKTALQTIDTQANELKELKDVLSRGKTEVKQDKKD